MSEPDGWKQVEVAERLSEEGAAMVVMVATAGTNERGRCVALVRSEIEEGIKRGIPFTSGTMIILHRLAHLIEHG